MYDILKGVKGRTLDSENSLRGEGLKLKTHFILALCEKVSCMDEV